MFWSKEAYVEDTITREQQKKSKEHFLFLRFKIQGTDEARPREREMNGRKRG
jgi:hypothetical protein